MADRALRTTLEAVQAGLRTAREDLRRGSNLILIAELEAGRATLEEDERALGEARAQVTEARRLQEGAQAGVDGLRAQLRRREQQQVAAAGLLAVALFVGGTLLSADALLHQPTLVFGAAFTSTLMLGAWLGLRLGRAPSSPERAVSGGQGYVLGALLTVVSLAFSLGGAVVTVSSVEFYYLYPSFNFPLLWAAWPLGVVAVTAWTLSREPAHASRSGLVFAQVFGLLSLGLSTLAAFSAWWSMRHLIPVVPHAHRLLSTGLLLGLAVGWTVLGRLGALRRRLGQPLEHANTPARAFAMVGLLAALSLWSVHEAVLTWADEAHHAWRTAQWESDTYDPQVESLPLSTLRTFTHGYRSFAQGGTTDGLSHRYVNEVWLACLPDYLVAAVLSLVAVLAGRRFAWRRRALPGALRWSPLAASVLAGVLLALDVAGKLGLWQ